MEWLPCVAVVDDPTNPDYATPIGSTGPAENHRAIVDVSPFGWPTIADQAHLAVMYPVDFVGGTVQTGIAYSSDLGNTFGVGTDLWDQPFNGGVPARSLEDAGFPFASVAARITSVDPCPADLTADGVVDGADLGALLGDWGGSASDLTGDGVVDGADLGALLGAWGACA